MVSLRVQGNNLDLFFEPRSIAIIGSLKEGLFGGLVVIKSLLNAGFQGEIYPVNPSYQEINGLRVYSSIKDVSREIDLVLIITGARSVGFMGGISGLLYQQFAITIAISVLLSAFNALTLSPALAAIIIKAHHGEKRGFFRWFDNGFARLTDGYVGTVARAIRGWPIALAAFGLVIAGVVLMFRILPGSFVRDEDQGYFFVVVEASDTASQGVVGQLADQVQKIVSADPAVQDVAMVNGFSLVDSQFRNNAAVLFVAMKPFEERKDAALLSFSVGRLRTSHTVPVCR